MRILRKVTRPEVFIRLGLGLTFLYSGYDIYNNPSNWIGFLNNLPSWITNPILSVTTLETFLKIQGIAEIVFAVVILVWFSPIWLLRLVSIIVSIEIASILWFLGVDAITFRDIGLLGASLALVSITYKKK